MKTALLAALVVLNFTAVAHAVDGVPAGKYEVDAAHSKVGFEISHLVIATVEGKFNKYAGTLDADAKGSLSINADIDAASIDTGVGQRDDHLRSPDFFDVKKFPKITFKSKKSSLTGGKELKITGDLTIHGVTKEVTLDGKYLGSVKDAWNNERVVAQLSGKINRKDFGLTWNKLVEAGPTVGDEVSLSLKIEAIKAVPKK